MNPLPYTGYFALPIPSDPKELLSKIEHAKSIIAQRQARFVLLTLAGQPADGVAFAIGQWEMQVARYEAKLAEVTGVTTP
jgi:hypothetical protein